MCLRRRLETADQLRFLAALAGDQDYEPPFARLETWLGDLGAANAGGAAGDRAVQIMAAADALGGEVG